MRYTSSDIAKIVRGKLKGREDIIVNEIITDSRQIVFMDGMAFFAIRGKNHDGHDFINNLYKQGIRTFIVDRLPEKWESFDDAAFILTGNTISALQLLAADRRKMFRSPVIAVTGSAGKTIVKEWLAEVLGLVFPVLRSPKSFNSQVGVPLSVMKLDDKYRLGIFEAGISQQEEMEKLRKIILPDIGIITNIGDAHSENFKDNAEKAKEKLRLFLNASKIIYCKDHKLIDHLILSDPVLKDKDLISWSLEDPDAEVYVSKESETGDRTDIRVEYKILRFSVKIPFTDRASVENAITVVSACLAMGVDPEIIKKGISNLVSVAMRMEMKYGINGCMLIEDYYNSDPGSLGMAIDYLRSQNARTRTLILSDFVQSGRDEKELYIEVASLVKNSGLDRFIGIGPALSKHGTYFMNNSRFYDSTEDFIRKFSRSDFSNEIILIKGARKFEFEKLGKLLELQMHQTLLEVNLDAVSHNLNEFRRFLKPGTRIMAMVKAFAYGAGPAEISSLLEYQGVSYLGVAFPDEGADLRNAGVSLPIMVMNPDPSSFELMIRYNLEPELYSFESLRGFTEVASRHGLFQYPVHIKVDTGMHRLGFLPDDIKELSSRIKSLDTLRIISVFSHFAASEDPDYDYFTHKQAEKFLDAVLIIREAVGYSFLRHICNSSGIVRFPQYQFEMVRPGIGIYGVGEFNGLNLKVAGRFKTVISQVKSIPAGEPVGYNCRDVSDTDRIIAILPVGYADGLSRKMGNRTGEVFIRNKRAQIVGNVCMDMCMIDVTGLDAVPGDEAEIFGENIKIEEIALKCGTIPYEILTSIPGRVSRVFFRG